MSNDSFLCRDLTREAHHAFCFYKFTAKITKRSYCLGTVGDCSNISEMLFVLSYKLPGLYGYIVHVVVFLAARPRLRVDG